MKVLIIFLLALPLLSVAPIPQPHAYQARLAVRGPSTIQTHARAQQACTFETAPARLRQTIEDPIGYPYGFVTAFSCTGDVQAVIDELAERTATMQAEAQAYRADHPIAGLK
jgi:hypothetical protein